MTGILYGGLGLGRDQEERNRDPHHDRGRGEHHLFLPDRGGAAIVLADQPVADRLHLGGGGREDVADLGEDHVAGQLHLVAADVGARAALGGGELLDPGERFAERSDRGRDHLVEVDETLPEAVDAFLGALAPEGQALPGRDIRVQRRAHVEQQLSSLCHGGLGPGLRPSLTGQRVFIVEGAICDAGRNQQTDNEAGNANGPAKHQGQE